jgi:hypothetical protein
MANESPLYAQYPATNVGLFVSIVLARLGTNEGDFAISEWLLLFTEHGETVHSEFCQNLPCKMHSAYAARHKIGRHD